MAHRKTGQFSPSARIVRAFALWSLIAFGAGALLGQSPKVDEREIELLITYLASDRFTTREWAARQLSALGTAALPQLRKATASDDANVARQAKDIIREVEDRIRRSVSVQTAAFSNDRKYVAINNTHLPRGTIFVRSLETGRDLVYLRNHPVRVGVLDFSPDGNSLLCPGFKPAEHEPELRDHSIWLIEWREDKVVGRLKGHTDAVTAALFLPDGRHVLSSSFDGTLRLWDSQTQKEVRRFEGHEKAVFNPSLSPDGKRALSASSDKTMRLWDVETGKELRKWDFEFNVMQTRFSPDGKFALSTSGRHFQTEKAVGIEGGAVRLWDLESGKTSASMAGSLRLCTVSLFHEMGT